MSRIWRVSNGAGLVCCVNELIGIGLASTKRLEFRRHLLRIKRRKTEDRNSESSFTLDASLANGIGPRGADFGRTPVCTFAPEHAAWAGVLEGQCQPVLLNVVEARLQCLMDLFI